MAEGLSDFLAHWQYELATEQAAQARFAAELGFCPLHTWQLLAMSSPHGASVGYARLADQVARLLRESLASPADGDAIGGMVRDARNCRVCGIIHKYEQEYTQQLASLIPDATVRDTYRRSQGVCLRHLGMLLNACGDQADRAFLLTQAAQRFEEDAEDMQSYAVKHEALRRGLQNRNEEDAYRRTVIRIVGGRSVCVPWAEDGEI